MLQLIKEWPDLTKSTSNEDCYFLKKMCEEYKPKKILEIGTFVGKSAYAMASGSNCIIYTVDRDKDKFLKPPKYKHLSDRIIRHPNMDSIDFWKNYPDLDGFDFVFVDGWLRQEDVENIFQRTLDNFWFLCHDYRWKV
jgi:predicted O-methyltransferase YrrM